MRLLVLLTLLITNAVFPRHDMVVVRVTDLADGRQVLCRQMPVGGEVVLTFTHSMYGGDVQETFIPMPDGRLRRVEMTTANEAAAEYYAYDASVTRVDGRYRVDVPSEVYQDLVIHVDHVGHHRLTVNGERIDLLRRVGDGREIRLQAVRVGLIDQLTGQAC
jgi:hypothetical protein